MTPSTPKLLTAAHISSVPDREFERPATIDELKELAYLGSEIVFNVIHYVGFEQEQDDAWQILNRAHLETSAAHSFICNVSFVGLADWQKIGAA